MEIQRIKEKNSLHTFKDGIGTTEDNPIFATSQSRMRIGMHLKAVGLACGIRQNLSFHVARHTFGTLT